MRHLIVETLLVWAMDIAPEPQRSEIAAFVHGYIKRRLREMGVTPYSERR